MCQLVIFLLTNCFAFVYSSHHWIVTEGGRVEPKLDSAFPVKRPYDLPGILQQEERVLSVTAMHNALVEFKASVEKKWADIELESEFEKKLYASDHNCMYADKPLSWYPLNPVFYDFTTVTRPMKNPDSDNQSPPDCKKFSKLDFSLLTFPHLRTMQEHENMTFSVDEIESAAPLDIDLTLLLKRNHSDWTAYNLAMHYWQLHGNISNAIECARRAIHFAPKIYRYLPLFNLGTLLQSLQSLGEAAIVLHTAVDMDRTQYHSHLALGHVYTHLNDFTRAAGCYQNALSLRPDLITLAKQRAAVLCHERLISGLWEIDGALKKIVEELQDYSKLQERWMMTHTQISMEKACVPTTTSASVTADFSCSSPLGSSPVNLHSMWKAVEQQTSLLTERITQTKPAMGSAINFENMQDREDTGPKMLTKLNALLKASIKAEEVERQNRGCRVNKPYRVFSAEVNEFYEFMKAMRYHKPSHLVQMKIVEKLAALAAGYEVIPPVGTPFWATVRRCFSMFNNMVLLIECGQKVFVEYLEMLEYKADLTLKDEDYFTEEELKKAVKIPVDDEGDESTIENYVQDNKQTNHESAEL